MADADGQEVRIYSNCERRARKEAGLSQRFARRFETALQALHEGLARPRTTKTIDKLWERIGRRRRGEGRGGREAEGLAANKNALHVTYSATMIFVPRRFARSGMIQGTVTAPRVPPRTLV